MNPLRPPSPRPPRTWLVTGASSGLGLLIAELALSHGDRVLLTGRRLAPLEELVACYPGQARALRLDVTDPQEVQAVAAKLRGEERRLDALVHAAGLGPAAWQESEKEPRQRFETRVLGPLRLVRALLPLQHGLTVVHLSTELAAEGCTDPLGYGVSRFALAALSRGLAEQLGPLGVRVLHAEPARVHAYSMGARGEHPSHTEEHLWSVSVEQAYARAQWRRWQGDWIDAAEAIVAAVNSSQPPPWSAGTATPSASQLEQGLERLRLELSTWEHAARLARTCTTEGRPPSAGEPAPVWGSRRRAG